MLDILGYPFMQRALVAGLVVGMLASYYGVFVVQRQLSFLGTGLAHAAFGGVALGLLLGAEPLWIAVPFTIVVALAIFWVRQQTTLSGDTAVGIFFDVAVALGIVFLSLKRTFSADAFAYLFGSILAVSEADVWVALLVAAAALGTAPLWSRWAYATFDRELALADGLPVVRDDYLLAVLLAVTIVVAVKVVGILLIVAFLVIPPATARLLARTFRTMTLCAVGIGIVSVLLGLVASYHFDMPSGATIILVQAALFFTAFALKD